MPAHPAGGAGQTAPRRPSGRGSAKPPAPVVVSRYVYDFGHVVSGTIRHKRFRMQNVGAYPVIGTWDKTLLAANGFSVSPENMPKLPGRGVIEIKHSTHLASRRESMRVYEHLPSM
jgi:hypothetical protein